MTALHRRPHPNPIPGNKSAGRGKGVGIPKNHEDPPKKVVIYFFSFLPEVKVEKASINKKATDFAVK